MSTSSQPTKPSGRNLIVAFDGTADTYDNDITNIVRLFSLLDKASPDEQLVYYQPGIGTYLDPSFFGFSTLMRGAGKLLDQCVAWYLEGHIMGGYQFLMDNWRPGDKILLFGFSRGAYTARCLAGMLHKVGLLPRNNKEQVQFAYEYYKDATEAGERRARGFKKAFSNKVLIEFVGVWDTVASVGLFYSRSFPFTTSNTIIKNFRHALALDERRAKFQANTWHHDKKCNSDKSEPDGTLETWWNNIKSVFVRASTSEPIGDHAGDSIDLCGASHEGDEPTNVLEVWFAGCHADVGGGSVSNDTKANLALPSMRWMVNEILDHTTIKFNKEEVLHQLGIDCGAKTEVRRSKYLDTPTGSKFNATDNRFHGGSAESLVQQSPDASAPATAVTESFPISPTTDATRVDDTTSSVAKHARGASARTVLTEAEEQEYLDATALSYDMLSTKPMWWILEFIPFKKSSQNEDGSWHTTFRSNIGQGRNVRQSAPLFHSSVRTRMDAGPQNVQGGGKEPYRPRAQFLGPPTFVD